MSNATATRRTVLVTNATEPAGGRLALLLLRRNHRVRAAVDDEESREAKNLADAGAEIVQVNPAQAGDWRRAAEGCYAACVMGHSLGAEPESTLDHAEALVEGFKGVRLPFVVLASSAASDRDTNVPTIQAQRDVERRVMTSGLPYAIVGSTFLMESLLGAPLVAGLREGELRFPLPRDKPLQMLALADLAEFCAHCIENKDHMEGKRIDIASDELTMEKAARVLSDLSRKDVRFVEQRPEDVGQGRELYRFLREEGYRVDLEKLQHDFPNFAWLNFRQWCTMQDWGFLSEAKQKEAERGARRG